MFDWFKSRRRKNLLAEPWRADWESVLLKNVGHYQQLSADEQAKLRDAVKVIVSEKHWEAHGGLTLTEEMKVTVAGTASLLLLGVDGFYFDRVKTIILFPQPIRREAEDGLTTGGASHNAGEAWQSGQVVLSWRDVLYDSRNPSDGSNVVIHEFAHCLDGLDGEMGGSLMFPDPSSSERWKQVSESEFQALESAARRGKPTVLDHYGALNRAEFFAVCSEAFFEKPCQLKKKHSELFELLQTYFQLDPTKWQ